jgi:urea transport system substrate-binding protein
MRAGALLAIDEVNADPALGVTLRAVDVDPGGVTPAYVDAVQSLLVEHRITHIFGCYTSSSRKEVLPQFEKNDALLWYPSHYEGFETSENVVYTGAAPNQHIIPLARYLLDHHGNRGWFVGSNYIWAWENNRILREAMTDADGSVLGERYFSVGDTDFGSLVDQIVADRPDFIFTTLIGESGYAFFRQLRERKNAAGLDPCRLPVASCSLSEVELPLIGDAAAGHLSSSVYFSTTQSAENARFTKSWDQRFGHLGHACADAEATYTAVHLLARAVCAAGSAGFEEVRAAVRGMQFVAPQGLVTVDPENLHCWMRPRIGRSTTNGDFELIFEADRPIRPDPYLVWVNGLESTAQRMVDNLRVVR